MTHRTDCTVTDEGREAVDRMAEHVFRREIDEANELADELGWEFLGRGVARAVYRVSGSDQTGPRKSATEQAPCVVKFSQPPTTGQNRAEIHQFRALPRDLTEPRTGDPIFVPVKDWDREDDRWLSMPEVDGDAGSIGEVVERLDRAGWHCDDVHRQNVGAMHNTSVLLDYGLDCVEQAATMEQAIELESQIDRHGARSIVVEEHRDGTVSVEFLTPASVPPGEPVEASSTIWLEPGLGVTFMDLAFGDWDSRVQHEPPLEAAARSVAEQVGLDWIGVHPEWRLESRNHDVDVIFRLDVEPLDGDVMPPDIAGEVFDDVVEGVASEFPAPRSPSEGDVEAAVEGVVEEFVQTELGGFDRESVLGQIEAEVRGD